jgi:hypothetical protein
VIRRKKLKKLALLAGKVEFQITARELRGKQKK